MPLQLTLPYSILSAVIAGVSSTIFAGVLHVIARVTLSFLNHQE